MVHRIPLLAVGAGILLSAFGCRREQPAAVHPEAPNASVGQYFRARHGFDGGLTEMVDLSKRPGFDAAQTLDDLNKLAREVPRAIGFTAHPNFERGQRYASAVLWYTKRSPISSSWALYLFDQAEAQKIPGDPPRAAAAAAAEAKLSGKMAEAKQLIEASRPGAVKLVGDYEDRKVLALAVMRLGGAFEHTASFGLGTCGGCRTVIPGGNPSACGFGVQGIEHWSCCGATNETGRCQYWELIKAQDDAR